MQYSVNYNSWQSAIYRTRMPNGWLLLLWADIVSSQNRGAMQSWPARVKIPHVSTLRAMASKQSISSSASSDRLLKQAKGQVSSRNGIRSERRNIKHLLGIEVLLSWTCMNHRHASYHWALLYTVSLSLYYWLLSHMCIASFIERRTLTFWQCACASCSRGNILYKSWFWRGQRFLHGPSSQIELHSPMTRRACSELWLSTRFLNISNWSPLNRHVNRPFVC